MGHLSNVAQPWAGPKFKILLRVSFVPWTIKYSQYTRAKFYRRGPAVSLEESVFWKCWHCTDLRTFDRFYNWSRERWLQILSSKLLVTKPLQRRPRQCSVSVQTLQTSNNYSSTMHSKSRHASHWRLAPPPAGTLNGMILQPLAVYYESLQFWC